MIISILSILLFLIFSVLGSFHFYWVFGGIWGLENVIPSRNEREQAVSIPKFATLIVGLTLSFFGFMYLLKSGYITVPFPNWITNYGFWFIPVIFILRAIGDFNYVGLFKKTKNTAFAKADCKIFIPLCFVIGIIGIIIQLIDT